MRRSSLLVVALFSILSTPVLGAVTLKSMCYVQDKTGAVVEGTRTEELFEIASVSKVVTSYWALGKLGPDFRFTTRFHVTPRGQDLADVHIQGGRDPFWGRDLTNFMISELNRIGVRHVRQLSFDENFQMRWRVMEQAGKKTINPTPDEMVQALKENLPNFKQSYTQTLNGAKKVGVVMSPRPEFRVDDIVYLPKNDFKSDPSVTKSYALKSAPLYRYLKEMNNQSNNQVADKIFEFLGGKAAFDVFAKSEMNMTAKDLIFVNGSGDSNVIGQDADGKDIKEYNKASCNTIVRVIIALRRLIRSSGVYGLQDIMAVSGTDDSTLGNRYKGIPNGLIAKTGTVDPAITLAGMLSTQQGNVFFGVFMGTEGYADWDKARNLIRPQVFNLISKYGGLAPFSYQASSFMQFDTQSALAPFVNSVVLKAAP